MSLQEALDRLFPHIEQDLREVVCAPSPRLEAYYGMMRYHLGWADEALQPVLANRGKRLRPVLCLLACEAAGGSPHQALPAASALELVHNFSLVHDDIQDRSAFRRGRPAVWGLWGEAQGINVGDGLCVLARLALHRLADRGVPFHRQQAATLTLDQACLALCQGQFCDMAYENRLDVDLEQYLWMIRHKTAALLAASTKAGAIIATDEAGEIEHYYCFGENLGMAFQIQDDILGAWGDEQRTGKSAAIDIRDKKKTLPVVYALNHATDGADSQRLADLYARSDPLDESAVRSALGILERVGAREYAEETARAYYRRALESLTQTGGEHRAKRHLRELAASLLGRVT